MRPSIEARATMSCAINFLQEHHGPTAGKLACRPKPIGREVSAYGTDWSFSIRFKGEERSKVVVVLVDYIDSVASARLVKER